MSYPTPRGLGRAVCGLALTGGLLAGTTATTTSAQTRSTTLALLRDDNLLLVVNRDANSVSLLQVSDGIGDVAKKVDEIAVGNDPRSIAVTPDGRAAFVTNGADGTVSVLGVARRDLELIDTISVGTEPRGCALTPNGKFLYVANHTEGTVSVIDKRELEVIDTIPVGGRPWAIAISDDGDAIDDDEKVYVTQFYSRPIAGGPGEAFDDGREGVVSTFPVALPQFLAEITLAPTTAAGFTADRAPFCQQTNPLAHSDIFCPDPLETDPLAPSIAADPQGAFPNQLHALVIRENLVYIPSISAAPEPPVKFNVNVQAFVHVVDSAGLVELAGRQVNLNDQIKLETQPSDPTVSLDRVFANDIVDIEANAAGNEFLIVSRGGNYVMRATLDGDGKLDLGAPNVTRIQTGNIPNGVVMSADGTRAYVNNEIDRSVTVIDLTTNATLNGDIASSDVPLPGTKLHRQSMGKLAFFTALGIPDNGVFDIGLRNVNPIADRGKASDNGWSSCASCHPDGLSDEVTWSFPTGPRQTIALDSFFADGDDSDQRVSNWNAVRGSITDFNNNSRNIQGGIGFAGDPPPAEIFNHGITQGASDALDAMTEWVKIVRTLDMPDMEDPFQLANALNVFGVNCASCHGGPKWTKSTVVYQDDPAFDSNPLAGGSPLDPGIANAGPQIISFTNGVGTLQILDDVGTFNGASPHEIRGAGGAIGQGALGGLGFNAPSLLGVGAKAPFFHDGSAPDLPTVWIRHLLPGGAPIATALPLQDLIDVATFVRSLDQDTIVFPSSADAFK